MSNIYRQRISKNFFLDEFLCKCANNCIYSMPEIAPDVLLSQVFLDKLQMIRDDIGKPFRINSGARCIHYNEEIGGAKLSAHLVTALKPCEAADISTVGWSGAARYKFLRSALKHNMWGFGIAKNFIHIDSKKSRKSIWSYS